MKLGLVTDSLSSLPLTELLDACANLGITQLEFATGGWSNAPHLDVDLLLNDAEARAQFQDALSHRGLEVCALNANGNPLHPVSGPAMAQLLRKTVDLAQLLGVKTVVTMSGLPGGAPGDITPNWVTTSWPPETAEILDFQWNTVAIPFWKEMAAYGADHGVRFALEMHGSQLVYNAETLLKLRAVIGDSIGANFDPSHPMWMGADPSAMARALDGVIYHVHAKDTRINETNAGINGVLDTKTVDQARDRSWNYVTLGLGYPGGSQFWGRWLCDLRQAGYDGVLSIEHEDVTMDSFEGVAQTAALLNSVLPVAEPSWKPMEL